MSAALVAEGLHTFYGKSHILHGVSLEAAEGQVTALLGRNGAGKTTTLRSLMGSPRRATAGSRYLERKPPALAAISGCRPRRRLRPRRPQDFSKSHG